MRIDQLTTSLRIRLDAFRTGGDPAVVLEIGAYTEALALSEAIAGRIDEHAEAAAVVGWLHWHRYLLLPEPDDRPDLEAAVAFFGPLVGAHNDLIPEPLLAVLYTRPDATLDDCGRDLLVEDLLQAYQETGELDTLDEALTILRHMHGTSGPANLGVTTSLIKALLMQSERTGSTQSLQEAVDRAHDAIRLRPQGHSELGHMLALLGTGLIARYHRAGMVSDLDEAITAHRHALAVTADDHPGRAGRLLNLGVCLFDRYERTGSRSALDEAVLLLREAVALVTSPNDRARYLSNLGLALRARYNLSGELADLDEAVAVHRHASALDSEPGDGARLRSNLGLALRARHERTGDLRDLDSAIEAGRAALAYTPQDHPDHPRYLSNLGLALRARHERTGDLRDLDSAIEAGRTALAYTPQDHPDHPRYLSNLGLALRARHERTGDLRDLDSAIEAGRTAVAYTPQDHPDLAGRLLNLGGTLQAKAKSAHSGALYAEMVQVFRAAMAQPTAPMWVRAECATHLGRSAAAEADWPQAVDAFTTAIDMVNLSTRQGSHRADSEFHLERFSGIVSDAVACALNTGDSRKAVQLWEHGRGVLLSRALDLRTDLTALGQAAPALAQRLYRLQELFAATAGEAQADTAGHDAPSRRMALADEWDQLVNAVRQLPGFHSFLRKVPHSSLLNAAVDGPIVLLNVSGHRSDALILSMDGVAVLPLPAIDPETVLRQEFNFREAVNSSDDAFRRRGSRQTQDQVGSVLEWLWDSIVGPVLDHLAITGDRDTPWPRIWWCPSGPLSFLPLHAAGYHAEGVTSRPRTALDLVVSSYTPTVRALIHARNRRDDGAVDKPRVLAVAMPHTPYAADLPAAGDEVRGLRSRFPEETVVLSGNHATMDAVLSAISEASVAHFACHGFVVPDEPSSSGLMLSDQSLTIRDLSALRLNRAEFAFLSACMTAHPNPRLADESLTLASSFQLAGFRHVVANMWPIPDEAAHDIADMFYGSAQTDRGLAAEGSAVALHETVRAMRARFPCLPAIWAATVHVGP